jgi:putative FmdB family regulatory protein
MPTYEYECGDCGLQCEFFQSITEGAKRKCPNCGKLHLKRIISRNVGVIFKGDGFYCNDYPKDKKDG